MPSMPDRTVLPEDLYRRAVTLGRGAAGISGPNPPVGCVIVREGSVIGEGATAAAGGPHAEIAALAAAGEAAHGATAIVTLEPCAHDGRTGPCTRALIEAGVREVHVILHDPDPVAAGGIAQLRAAGVVVVEVGRELPGIARDVLHDLRGFFSRVGKGRPHVVLKLAQTPDGGTIPGSGGYLTGMDARTRVHALRADVDAVLVGSGTVRSDDPLLTVRHVPAPRQPRPVVIATTADLPRDARILSRGALVITGGRTPSASCEALAQAGATVVRVPEVTTDGRVLIDLPAALAALLDHRILTVLAEPGRRLADALLAADVVDAIELHIAGPVPGESIVPALARLGPVVEAWRMGSSAVQAEEMGPDVVLRASRTLLTDTSVLSSPMDPSASTVEAA